MITILQISYFMELVKYMSFSKAAEYLYISQPALSKQISNLEKELGFLLFDRNGKNIELNDEGRLMYNYFNSSKNEFNNVLVKAKQSSENKIYNLNVSCLSGWDISKYFTHIIEIFEEKYKNINLKLESRDSMELMDNINNGSDDIIITLIENLDSLKNINLRYITDIKRFIVYSKTNRINDKTNLNLNDFKNENFFVFAKLFGKTSNEILKEICSDFGFEPRVTLVSNIDSMMLNVETGKGVAIFDEWHRVLNSSMLKSLDTGTNHRVHAAWKKENSNKDNAINLFLDEFIKVVNEENS